MRHQVKGKKLNRNTKQRKALFLSLSRAMILEGGMVTTLPKAKVFRSFFEKLISRAKKGDFNARREVSKVLRRKQLTNILVDEIAPVFKNRPGGYLRIIRLPRRGGDDAPMAKVELVEKIEKTREANLLKNKEPKPRSGKIKNKGSSEKTAEVKEAGKDEK